MHHDHDDDISPTQIAASRWMAAHAPEWIAAEFVNHTRKLKARNAVMAVQVGKLQRQVLMFRVAASIGAFNALTGDPVAAIVLTMIGWGVCLIARRAWKFFYEDLL